jgi:isopropylmalate/homocitrate/citramalate synthase
MGHDTTIYDTTLRDGCQGAGISLALRDKLDIARRLDEAGIDYVEGGWPGSNPKDAGFFAALLLERHGSLADEDVRAVAREHGFDLVLGERAGERLPLRDGG